MIRILLLIVLLLACAPVVQAQTLFFNELGDVPVMPALQELPERTLVFDKPSGIIAQVTALPGQGITIPSIMAFYAESLPQFGWQKEGGSAYVREEQKLTISPLTEGGRTLLVFRLEPR